jgi:ssDNA-binding Zn-finger/Zn-ribbon topoisomerase 1
VQISKGNLSFAFALIAIFLVGVWFFRTGSAKKLEGPPLFLQCTECPFEKAYVSRDEDKLCPNCKLGKLAPANQSSKRKSEGPVPFYSNYIALGLIVATLGMGAVYIYLTLEARKKGAKEQIAFLYTRCHTCKRRIKYAPVGVERAILCPTCRTEIILPPVATISS